MEEIEHGRLRQDQMPHGIYQLQIANNQDSQLQPNQPQPEALLRTQIDNDFDHIANDSRLQGQREMPAIQPRSDETPDEDDSVGDAPDPLWLDHEYDYNDEVICNDLTLVPLGIARYLIRFQHQREKFMASRFYNTFDRDEKMAIKLLDALRRKGATLDTYEAVLDVVFRDLGLVSEVQSVTASARYVSRAKILRKLSIRHCLVPHANVNEQRRRKKQRLPNPKPPKYYIEKPIILPFSRAKVDVICWDFRQNLIKLLTDPRFKDSDYVHYECNPLAPPPDQFSVVNEIISGRAYRETYNRLITKPNQQLLLPIIFYVDATQTAQFTDLKIEGVKFGLGIHTNQVRH